MKSYFILFIACFLAVQSIAQEKFAYPVKDIPTELVENAEVVTREEKEVFNIKALDNIEEKVTKAYTIFTKRQEDYAYIVIGYDSFTDIDYIKAAIYDKNGKLVKKLKKSDIQDLSASGSAFKTDNRVKIADMRYGVYPYTIWIQHKTIQKQSFNAPRWSPIYSEKHSVQQSSLEVHSFSKELINYFERNLKENQKLNLTQIEDTFTFKWEMNNQPCIERERLSRFEDIFPSVSLSFTEFKMQGTQGKQDSWQNFGKWKYNLLLDRNELPESVKQEVHEIADKHNNDYDKAKALYEYMQNKVRYVNVSLGIGGWQPQQPAWVEENGFGDCKALTNYLRVALKEIGIESLYTSVRAGEGKSDINEEMPSQQFNHVFLCIPLESDTVWAECTSQKGPFNYHGTFTNDRQVLIHNQDGGKLVRTPKYKSTDNQTIISAEVDLFANGNADAQFKLDLKGVPYEDIEYIYKESTDKQKEYLKEDLSIGAFEVTEIETKSKIDGEAKAQLQSKLKIRNLASKSGQRLFIPSNIFYRTTYKLRKDKNREYNFEVGSYDNEFIEKTVINLPKNVSIEFIPEENNIETIFGSYHSKITQEEGKLIFEKKEIWKKGYHDKSLYNDYVSFMNEVRKADKQKIVLVVNDTPEAKAQ
ncbi:DUF3857 domain-containing protein [Sediminitomix flava]|uniref:Transglutaminase superfamily protein n=1 Tax=Sediminitomix flava TaxID=379075 RepID=A0A315ZEU7_SEDFL|nr:DUF3857 domain-containing protein [Sediminitomix flava]PWJ44085.1 transglutaminase superfamily protein [Sediminitomix flava]